MEPISAEVEIALRNSQSHPDRVAVAEPSFQVNAVLRNTWMWPPGLGQGPRLVVEQAMGGTRQLVAELMSEKPQPPMPEAMNAALPASVKYLLVAGDGVVARPPMPDLDWDSWSPSEPALAVADFAQIGEVDALTQDEWQERLHPRRSRP